MTGKIDFPVPISEQALYLIKGMLKIEPEERISIPSVLRHPWLRTSDEFSLDDTHDTHDFEMGISFRRQECNFNPLSMIGLADGAAGANSNKNAGHQRPSNANAAEGCGDGIEEATQESNNVDENLLLTEQETNPMH